MVREASETGPPPAPCTCACPSCRRQPLPPCPSVLCVRVCVRVCARARERMCTCIAERPAQYGHATMPYRYVVLRSHRVLRRDHANPAATEVYGPARLCVVAPAVSMVAAPYFLPIVL